MLLRIRRRRRAQRRAVAEGLRLLAGSITAPEEVKQAGLEQLLAEFDRGRGRSREP